MLMSKTKTKSKKVVKSAAVAKRSTVRRVRTVSNDTDAVYILKLVLYLILGSQWLRLSFSGFTLPLPIGLLVGLIFAHAEKYPIDRRIQYAILLLSMFTGFWLPIGFEIVL